MSNIEILEEIKAQKVKLDRAYQAYDRFPDKENQALIDRYKSKINELTAQLSRCESCDE